MMMMNVLNPAMNQIGDTMYPWDAVDQFTECYPQTDAIDPSYQNWYSPGSASYSDQSYSDQENYPLVNNIQGSQHLTTKIKAPLNRKLHQRSAANQRERRRMRTINEAFEDLRQRIPVTDSAPEMIGADRKLSKVDTLKFAIRYIQQLSDVIRSCDKPQGEEKMEVDTKVVLRCKTSAFSDCMHAAQESSIYGHSLSFEPSTPPPSATSNPHRLTTTLWVPQVATEADLNQQPDPKDGAV